MTAEAFPMAGLSVMYADLHIHIGRTEKGNPVKISGSRDLTFFNIAREAGGRKGIHITGIIDCHSPEVLEEIERYLENGAMAELRGGGIRYGGTTVLLGSELEVKDPGRGPAHLLVFLPTLSAMKDFSAWLRTRVTNIRLSSQRVRVPARELQAEAVGRGGMVIPAHIFTPHKSLYGRCCDRMADVLDPDRVAAVELGLSSNTEMADAIPELRRHAFVTNSDAHSLGRIAREYNALLLAEPTFEEVALALRGAAGRRIEANYGLSPQLGKYHSTYCVSCGMLFPASGEGEAAGTDSAAAHAAFGGAAPESVSAGVCPRCGGRRLVRGVSDRIADLAAAGAGENVPRPQRPPYIEQVPLEFIPGLGPKKLERLLERFGTEMNVLHHVPEEELAEAVGPGPAALICACRAGKAAIAPGGGGVYGKIR